MAHDDRDILDVLKFELTFLEQGGYGRSVRTPWKPTHSFQDSLSCLNFGDPERTHPCEECVLMQLVPKERRGESVPCHHIPLNPQGETVETLENQENQQVMEARLEQWLRATIARLESERAAKTAASH